MTTKVRKNIYVERDAAEALARFARANGISFSQAVTIAGWRLEENPSLGLQKPAVRAKARARVSEKTGGLYDDFLD